MIMDDERKHPPDRYALIGQPVHHSRSPLIHSLFARETWQRLTYELIEASPRRRRSTRCSGLRSRTGLRRVRTGARRCSPCRRCRWSLKPRAGRSPRARVSRRTRVSPRRLSPFTTFCTRAAWMTSFQAQDVGRSDTGRSHDASTHYCPSQEYRRNERRHEG